MKECSLLMYKSTNVIAKVMDFGDIVYCMRMDIHPFTNSLKLSVNKNKDSQPTFTPRGTFTTTRCNENFKQFSGLIFIDIDFDDQNNNGLTKDTINKNPQDYQPVYRAVEYLKAELIRINLITPLVCMIKYSFSRLGIHLFIDIGSDTPHEDLPFWYKLFHNDLETRFLKIFNDGSRYKFKVDKAVNFNAVMAIMSYDPELFYDPQAVIDRLLYQEAFDDYRKRTKVTNEKISALLTNHKVDNDDKQNFIRVLKHINENNIVMDYEARKVYQYLYFYIFEYNENYQQYSSIMWDLYEPAQRLSSENYHKKMKRDFRSFLINVKQKIRSGLLYTNIGMLYDMMSRFGLHKAENEVVINIEKRLDEKQVEVYRFFDTHSRILMEADTGIGKTYTTILYLKQKALLNPHKNYVLCVPTTVQVEQICNEYSDKVFNLLPACSTYYKPYSYDEGVYNNIRITTYDSTEKISDVDILVMDEAHHMVKSFGFRSEALQKLDEIITNMLSLQGTKVIFLTATPDSMLLDYQKLTVVSAVNKKLPMDVIWARNKKDKLFDIVEQRDKSKNIMYVILNMKIQQQLKEKFGLTDVINSQCKDSELLQGIVNTSLIMSGVTALSTTNIIAEGINILNEKWDEIVFFDVLDIDTIRQFTARFRVASPHITLVMGLPKSDEHGSIKKKPMFSRDYVYRFKLLEAKEICDKLNSVNASDIEMFRTDDTLDNSYEYCWYKEKDKLWVPNEWKLKKDIDDIFFHALYKRPDLFVSMLGYYYDVVRVLSEDNITRSDTAIESKNMVDLQEFFRLNKHRLLEISNKKILSPTSKLFFDENKNIIQLQIIQLWLDRFDKMKELGCSLEKDIDIIFEPTRIFNIYIKTIQYNKLAIADEFENGKRQLSGEKIRLVFQYLKTKDKHVYNIALADINQLLKESGNIPFTVSTHKNGSTFSTSFTQFLSMYENIEVREKTINKVRYKFIFFRNVTNEL